MASLPPPVDGMLRNLTVPSLREIFRFPFQVSKWPSRFLVGTVLLLASYVLPIVPAIFVAGYVLRVMRQTLNGQDPALPAWDDWGELARDGLRVTVVSLVYFLPALLTWMAGFGLYFFFTLYLPLRAGTGAEQGDAAAMFLLLTLGSMALLFISMFLGTLLSLLGAMALPVATAHFVARDKLSAAFRIREWWRVLSADKLGYFISWVIAAGLFAILYLGTALAYYTLVLCCLLPFLVTPLGLYIALVGAALFGQTYRESAALIAAGEQGE